MIGDLRSQLSTYSSSRVTLYNEEQLKADYEKKLKDQAMNYEKLISGLKSGTNVLTNTTVQYGDKAPQSFEDAKRSNQFSSGRLLDGSKELELSRELNASSGSLNYSKSLASGAIHPIGHSNVLPSYYYMPGQQPTFRP